MAKTTLGKGTRMLADYHVHTNFSDDSWYPLEKVAADAIRVNLDEICVTDHVDYGVKPDWGNPEGARLEYGLPVLNVDYDHYFPHVAEMRERFAPDLAIACGLELGVQRHTVEPSQALVERWASELDFVLLSIHQVDDLEFWMGDYQKGRTQAEIHDAYYSELLAVMDEFDGWDCIAHLDLVRRYDPYGDYPFDAIRDQVAAVLEKAIAKGKAIEVNTSGIRYGLGEFQPSDDILRLYRDLGGTCVTIGSDSHKPEHLGAYVRLAQKKLAALGFETFATFRHREPIEHSLEP